MNSKQTTIKSAEARKRRIILPKLRFPEFREAEGWIAKSLKFTCELNPANSELPEEFVYIDLESVESGELKARQIIKRDEAPSRAQRLLRSGDVIFQIVRPYQRNNLHFKINDAMPYVASTGYAQLRANESDDFLFQAVHTEDFVDQVIAKCTGSSYPAINSSDLAEILLSIPNKDEQQKLAACLSSLDELITAERLKLDALKAHRKGLMQQLFPAEGETTPRLRFASFKRSWREYALKSLIQKLSSGRDTHDPSGVHDLYGSTGIIGKTGTATHSGEHILVARVGANAGLARFVNDQFGATDNTLVIEVDKSFCSRFIFYYLCSLDLSGMVFGSGQPLITGGQLKALTLFVPDESEQLKLVDVLTGVERLISHCVSRIEFLKAHKTGLMQQLFPSLDEVQV